jgi:hypothetical protein
MADDKENRQPDVIIITGKRHPLDQPSVAVGVDGKLGVSSPCPIKNVGPVNLTCEAGVNADKAKLYGKIMADVELPKGFRAVVGVEAEVGADSKRGKLSIGVESPPIKSIGGGSVSVSVDPRTGKPSLGYRGSF